MKYFIFTIFIFLIGCDNSQNTQSGKKEQQTTNEEVVSAKKRSFPIEIAYLENIYQPKSCEFGYYENNSSICQNSEGNIDNPYLLNVKDHINIDLGIPNSSLHDQIHCSQIESIIQGAQYNKDIWCQEAYEVALNPNGFIGNTLSQDNYFRNQISKESFNVRFYQDSNTTHMVLIKPSQDNPSQHYIAHQKYDYDSIPAWENESLVWTAVAYCPELYDSPFIVIVDDDICFKKENGVYCKHKNANEPFVLTRQYSSNIKHKDWILDDGIYRYIISFPIHDQGIMRVAFETDEGSLYSSSIETPYTFTLEDAKDERNESICQPLQFHTKFGKTFSGIFPLIIDNSWDKKSFIVSMQAGDEAYSEDLIGLFGYTKILYSFNKLACINGSWELTPILLDGSQYVSYPADLEESIRQSAENAYKKVNAKSYENNINWNAVFYALTDHNGTVEGVQNKSISSDIEKKIATARAYFYEELMHYLTDRNILHIISRVNRCDNMVAEYSDGNTGYLINGTMKSYIYHYILDLKKDNYLEPIQTEYLGEFEW